MIRLALLLLLVGIGPALGQTVRVSSGEHDGFTRLVMEFGQGVNWQVGRNADGYVLRVVDGEPQYDLSRAFAIIGKTRLAAISQSEPGGDLQFSLACACHAVPFEFRPGIIVVDLKDGPPPDGSSFELALPDPTLANDAASPPTGAMPYDWKAEAYRRLGTAPAPATASTPPDPTRLMPVDPDLQPLRETVVRQMARGASQGLIEMAEPGTQVIGPAGEGFASAQIRIGDAPTRVTQPDIAMQGEMGAQGAPCIAPEALAIADWADPVQPISAQMAEMRRGLTGEFDRAEPEQVARAIRFMLYIGFGAEARQMVTAFQPDHPDRAVWQALGHLLDEEPDPDAIFDDQASCAGPAALWALLADPGLSAGDPLDEGAIRRAFSELPLHLRRQIGPALAERFLSLGRADAARAIGDAITRAPGTPDAATQLMAAELDLHGGDPAGAERIAAPLAEEAGPDQPEALIALVEARAAQGQPVTPDMALTLRALLSEHRGTDLEPRLQAALALAEAASGAFDAAFAALSAAPDRQDDVWSLLVALAPDGDFLSHAVLPPDTPSPAVPDDLKAEMARRLVALGLADAATPWLETTRAADPVLLAEAALKRNDARAALVHLAGLQDPVATALKLQALERLGQETLRAEMLAEADQGLAASAALARSGDWGQLAQAGEDPWKATAQRAVVPTELPSGEGALAKGRLLLAAAPDTRAAIANLLAQVPPPPTGISALPGD